MLGIVFPPRAVLSWRRTKKLIVKIVPPLAGFLPPFSLSSSSRAAGVPLLYRDTKKGIVERSAWRCCSSLFLLSLSADELSIGLRGERRRLRVGFLLFSSFLSPPSDEVKGG